MPRYLWIMYVSQNIPGNQSFDLSRETSMVNAREAYVKFCDAVGTEDCSARLYVYSEESWASAEEYRKIGCPFDYPSVCIDRGPRNGVVITPV